MNPISVIASVASAGLLLAAPAAWADTTDWGSHAAPPGIEFGSRLVSPGSFTDNYLFTLPSNTQIGGSAVSLDLTFGSLTLTNIVGGHVDLFSGSPNPIAEPLDGFNFGTTSVSHSFGSLAAGSYYYQVTGNATGAAGGFYSISSALSPVPEVESWAMMLAGLGVVAGIARRRSKYSN